MRRVRYESTGGPLFLEEAPVPTPGPGELLVRTEAIGVTLPVVRKVTEAAEPIPLGGEIAGEVAAVGQDVTRFRVGERVTGLCFGHGYADLAVLHEAMASPCRTPPPPSTRWRWSAAGWWPWARWTRPEPNPARPRSSRLRRGVGHLAVQVARARGAGRVVGAVSDPAKADFVGGLGADEVITYDRLDRPDWGEPVDYVLDAVGGELLTAAVAALVPGGRLVAYSSGGGTIQAYDLLVGAKSVIGFQMARIARGKPELYERWRRELWRLFAEGALKPAVHREFALTEAAEAHRVIESRSNLGKVVLRP